MERYLKTRESWDVWLELLRARPDRERALDARASLLFEARGGDPALLLRTMLDAARVEDQLDATPVAAAPRTRPLAARAVPYLALLAAGLAVGILVPREPGRSRDDVTFRGEVSTVPGGTVSLEQGGRTLAKVTVGRGVRPDLDVREGPLVLRWAPEQPGARGRVVAWQAGVGGSLASLDGRPGEVTPIVASATPLTLANPQGSVVVAVLPDDADPKDVAERVGDGRHPVEPLGDVRVVVLDVEVR